MVDQMSLPAGWEVYLDPGDHHPHASSSGYWLRDENCKFLHPPSMIDTPEWRRKVIEKEMTRRIEEIFKQLGWKFCPYCGAEMKQ